MEVEEVVEVPWEVCSSRLITRQQDIKWMFVK